MRTLTKHRSRASAALCALPILIAGCTGSKPAASQNAPPPVVEVVLVEQKDMPVYGEWIGSLDGMVNAEIKAQVSGYLLRQNYAEGSFVRKGQMLFEIDTRPFQAALDQTKARLAEAEGQLAQANGQLLQAKAQLAQAQADQGKAQLDVNRLTPLARERAVSEQELDNAVQSNLAAKAKVEASAAGVETANAAIVAAKASIAAAQAGVGAAQLNLSFTRIISPISGIAGLAQAQVGNLVGPGGSNLTTVSTVDPIKAYFTVSEQEYLQYNRRNPSVNARETQQRQLELDLVLADGTTFPHKGKFFVADREVDVKTGAIRLAGLFPNPRKYSATRPVRPRPRHHGDQKECAVDSATRSLRAAGIIPGRRGRRRRQGNHTQGEGRRADRFGVCDRGWTTSGRARRGRRRPEGQTR